MKVAEALAGVKNMSAPVAIVESMRTQMAIFQSIATKVSGTVVNHPESP